MSITKANKIKIKINEQDMTHKVNFKLILTIQL